MIEKKQDVGKVHQLRIIEMLNADFNTAIKILFAKNLMYQAEQCGNLHDEQWGLRSNRTSTD